MALLDAHFNVIGGEGGHQGSLNHIAYPFQTFGRGAWFDMRILVSVPRPSPMDGELGLWTPGTPAPEMLGRGANDFAAGGGAFIAWLAGYGVWGTLETRLLGKPWLETPDKVRLYLAGCGTYGEHAVGDDGTIAYRTNRQATGFQMVAVDGTITVDRPDLYVEDLQVLGRDVCIYKGGAIGRHPARPAVSDAQGILLATIDGEDWLIYWSPSAGVWVQLDGASDGYLIAGPNVYANYRDIKVANNELVVAWSTTPGEDPHDYQVKTIDRSLPRSTIVPVVTPPSLTPPTRPVWFGFFEFQTAPQGPGSCALLVRNCSGHFPRPLIVDGESLNCVPGNQILGEFYEATSSEQAKADADEIAKDRRPIAYYDDNAWPFLPALPKGAWICQRMYQPITQSWDVFASEMDARVRELAGYTVVLVPQVSDTNATLSPTPFPAIQQLAFDLASKYLNVIASVGFNGFGRHTATTGGLDAHPDWLHACQVVAPKVQTPAFDPWIVTPPDPVPSPFPLFTEVTLMTPLRGRVRGSDYHIAGGIGKILPGSINFTLDGSPGDGSDNDPTVFELTKPDDQFTLRGIAANRIVNFPPKFDLQRIYETRAVDARAHDEAPMAYQTANHPGKYYVFVEHGGELFTSAVLIFEAI